MAMTPNSAHPPHVTGTTNPNPAVLNLRRPGHALPGAAQSHADGEVLMATAVDEAPPKLPPTALRLPNLAATPSAGQSGVAKVLSILHWVGIGLGAMIAWFLIFYGQNGSPEDFSTAKDAAAGAKVEASPEWKAPPLPSAGDSQAPQWTPPALAPEAEEAPVFQPAPAPTTPSEPHQHEAATEAPAFESWPKQDAAEGTPANPDSPLDQASTSSPMPPNPAGPVVRTAQREMRDHEPLNTPHSGSADSDDVQPLGITVPVPQ